LISADVPYNKVTKKFYWSNLEYPALCDGTYKQWKNSDPPYYPDGKPYWPVGTKEVVWVKYWAYWEGSDFDYLKYLSDMSER
jgi:hypothetical protein